MEWFLVILVLAGFVASFFSGLLGLGGSIILLPTLLLAFTHSHGYSPNSDLVHLAINTSLTIVFLNSIGNVWVQCRHQRVNWQLSYCLLPGVLAGVLFGALLGFSISPTHTSLIAGGLLIAMSVSLLYQSRHRAVGAAPVSRFKIMLSGVAVGAPSSLLGIGGGSMMIPVLHHIGIDMKKIVGTTAIFTCLTTFAALMTTWLVYFFHGKPSTEFVNMIDWEVVALLLPVMFVGVRLGSRCFNHIPRNVLRWGFMALLLGMGVLLILT